MKMPHPSLLAAVAILAFAPGTTFGDDGGDGRDGARRAAVRAAGAYRHCLLTHARELVAEITQPRALADAAARACEPVLTGLRDELAAEPLSEPERRWFVTSVRRNTLRRTLPELLGLAASRGGPAR